MLAGLAAAMLIASAAPARAQSNRSIINGGFEAPSIPAGTFQLINEENVPGWQTTASDAVMELWSNGFNGVPAFEGDQFAELNANLVATLFQPLCLVPGDTVSWSFAHRGRGGEDTIRLTIGADEITTETTGAADWAVYAGTYTPSVTESAPVDFFFESVSSAGGGSVGNFLDAVEIVLPPHYELSTASASDQEDSGGNLPVLLVSGTLTSAGSVDVSVSGSATDGEDFSFTATIEVPAGEYDGTEATAIPLGITIVDDDLEEGDEVIEIAISNPTGENAGLAARIADVDCNDTTIDVSTYTIADDDAPVCGDGTVSENEACDDGNTEDGDGCSSACEVETDYICTRADFSLVNDEALLGETGVAPEWTLSEDGFSVFQSVNSDPGVYVSSLPATGIGNIELTIAVETTNDDDFIGIVLGFDEGELTADDASYLLIDWKQGTQSNGGITATEGLAVSLVTGAVTDPLDLWGHENAVRELARAINLGATGWVDHEVYTWKLSYSETHLTLRVNDVVELDLDVSDLADIDAFPAGNFGFYNYSQNLVRYTLLSPRGTSICMLDPDDVCPGHDDDVDTDGDGVPDGCDVCPGSDDSIDTDGDGVPDGCDVCPMDPENDADGDGVCESDDLCPDHADPAQGDIDGDGIGDACDDDSGIRVQGGGCSTAGSAGGLGVALLLLALALALRRRRA